MLTAAAEAEAALGQLPDDILATCKAARAYVHAAAGAAHLWLGHFDRAAELLDEAVADDSATECGDLAGHRALLEAVQGRPARARELAARTVALARDVAGQPRPPATALVALAWAALERDRLDDCGKKLAEAQDALRVRPDRLVAAVGWLVAARYSVATRRPRVALERISQARRGWVPPSWLDGRLVLAEVEALVAAGEAGPALDAARRAGHAPAPQAAIALARALLATGAPHGAGEALARALVVRPHEVALDLRVQGCLLEAGRRYQTGEHEPGRRALLRAVRLAEPQQLRLPFKLERSWLEHVLPRDPELSSRSRCVVESHGATAGRAAQAAVAARRPAAPCQRRYAPSAPSGVPVVTEPLSEREREVLQHASSMLNTAEIADELCLSVNTVKSHLRSIFRKLGATRRGEAVRRARDLQLL